MPIKSTTTGTVINSLRQVPNYTSFWYPNLCALSDMPMFSVLICIFQAENGCNGILKLRKPSAMIGPIVTPDPSES
ncbi:hypothetical protein ACTXT7_000287 [Hymenolepis weldensis]